MPAIGFADPVAGCSRNGPQVSSLMSARLHRAAFLPARIARHLTHDLMTLHVLSHSLLVRSFALPSGLSGPGSSYYDLC